MPVWFWFLDGLAYTDLVQDVLFDGEKRQKQSRVDAAADQIKERFGMGALRRGNSLQSERPRTP